MTAKERTEMSDEAHTELKTTDVDAAKRFIVKNDQKGGYRLQCIFGGYLPSIYTQLPFPNRKALFEALDEIDTRNRPESWEYHHLPVEERRTVSDFIHDSNLRGTICTFTVDTDYCGGVYVGIKVERNPVWDAMTSQWHNERQAKAKAEAEAAGICTDDDCSWCHGEPTWEDDDGNQWNEPTEGCPVWKAWHEERKARFETTGSYNADEERCTCDDSDCAKCYPNEQWRYEEEE